ncbi:UPF0575 protein C19orf67 homolog [Coregonus clupeaformis]|uniref:UPF0575 protein C19orf67 homolog n=1 Tax=Coregonus clupeaformis TaxID=59861 RepID=UPI001E1C90EB|nr:UPF0575 protein C19orf67 homolog [Coregonus clupeaformis]
MWMSYFLCYEDVPEEPAEGGDGEGKGETVAIGNVVRMWSIGQWVQTQPEPVTDDIYEWVLCWVPQAFVSGRRGAHCLQCY